MSSALSTRRLLARHCGPLLRDPRLPRRAACMRERTRRRPPTPASNVTQSDPAPTGTDGYGADPYGAPGSAPPGYAPDQGGAPCPIRAAAPCPMPTRRPPTRRDPGRRAVPLHGLRRAGAARVGGAARGRAGAARARGPRGARGRRPPADPLRSRLGPVPPQRRSARGRAGVAARGAARARRGVGGRGERRAGRRDADRRDRGRGLRGLPHGADARRRSTTALAAAPVRRAARPRAEPGFARISVPGDGRVERPAGRPARLGRARQGPGRRPRRRAGARRACATRSPSAATSRLGGGAWEVAVTGARSGEEAHRLRVSGGVATSGHPRAAVAARGRRVRPPPARSVDGRAGLDRAASPRPPRPERARGRGARQDRAALGPGAARAALLRRHGGVLQHEDGRVEVDRAAPPVVRLPRPASRAAA